MLQLHIRRLQDPAERGIVLLLGASDWQRVMLREELTRLVPELGSQVLSPSDVERRANMNISQVPQLSEVGQDNQQEQGCFATHLQTRG